jgi:hypothetical protein
LVPKRKERKNKELKHVSRSCAKWLIAVIQAIPEVEIRWIVIQGQPSERLARPDLSQDGGVHTYVIPATQV